MNTPCIILGSGGHARVLIDAVRLSKIWQIVAALDSNPARHGQLVDGVPIVGDNEQLADLFAAGVRHAILGIGGTGDNTRRRAIAEHVVQLGFLLAGVTHPSAIVSATAQVDDSAQILAGAIIGPSATIGRGVLINTRAVIEHDSTIGDYAHISPGAVLSGGVHVGEMAHIGAGAAVRQGVNIGLRAIVGLGAAVVDDVPADITVVGVPARPMEKSSAT